MDPKKESREVGVVCVCVRESLRPVHPEAISCAAAAGCCGLLHEGSQGRERGADVRDMFVSYDEREREGEREGRTSECRECCLDHREMRGDSTHHHMQR